LLVQRHVGPVVIIIDDAQTMPPETLEDLRLLSNLETDKSKLLQMLLVGQPELMDQLQRPQLRQLRQRVALHCLLDFLNPEETAAYIARRLAVAGNKGQVRFDSQAIRRVHKQSGGVPRMINKICDLALTAAYAAGSHTVTPRHVTAAFEELVEARPLPSGARRWFYGCRRMRRRLVLTIAGLICLAGLTAYGFYADWAQGEETGQAPSAHAEPMTDAAGSRPRL
jgi:general secretion pathway protein A